MPFFDRIRIPNIIWFSENTEYRIMNTIWYWQNPNTKYQIPFGIEKNLIPNMNSTIWSNYSNTKYLTPNSIQNFGKKTTKINIFVSYNTFCLEILWNYSDRYSDWYLNTWILFGVQKKPNIKYQVLLFGLTIWIVFEYQIIHHTLFL